MGARLRMQPPDASAILRLPFQNALRKKAHMATRAAKLSPYWAERLYPSALVRANPLEAALAVPNELRPSGHSPAQIRKWILAVCRRLSLTPTEFARKAKLAPSTINRFISGKGENENVSASTIAKLSDAVDNLFKEFVFAENGFETAFKSIEVESNWNGESRTSFDKTVVKIPVVGYVSTNYWNSTLELPVEDKFDVSIPVYNAYAGLPIIGLEVRGGTSNKIFPNTSILICVPYYALDRHPVDREYVIVNRRNLAQQIEVTVRQYVEERYDEEQKPVGQWLIGLEQDWPFQSPIDVSYYTSNTLDDSLLISFLIISTIQPEPRLFRRPKELDPRDR